MSIATLILGESGTGKSTSLRNLDPKKVSVYQCAKKPLPFKSKDWKNSVFSYDDLKIVKVPKLDKDNKPTGELIDQSLTPEQAISRFLCQAVNDLPKLNHKDPLKVIHFCYFLITMFKSVRFITRF